MSTALLLAADSSDSSDDGSYVAHEESESDDEIEEPAAPERARSAAELIAALEDAPDEEIRAMMREARPLRSPPALPQDLLAAFKRRTSDLRVLRLGAAINVWTLCDALVTARALEVTVFSIFVLDEHVVLLSVRAGAVTLHAYDRHAVEAAMERHGRLTLGTAERVELNPDIVPIAEETLFASTEDHFIEEKILSYARYFESDEDGCWLVPWLPLADGSFRYDRAEQIVSMLPDASSRHQGEEAQQMQAMASVFSGDLSVLYRLKALEGSTTTPYQEHLPRSAFTRTPSRRPERSGAGETGPAASSSSSCGRSRQKARAARRRGLPWRASSAGSAPSPSSATSSGACDRRNSTPPLAAGAISRSDPTPPAPSPHTPSPRVLARRRPTTARKGAWCFLVEFH